MLDSLLSIRRRFHQINDTYDMICNVGYSKLGFDQRSFESLEYLRSEILRKIQEMESIEFHQARYERTKIDAILLIEEFQEECDLRDVELLPYNEAYDDFAENPKVSRESILQNSTFTNHELSQLKYNI